MFKPLFSKQKNNKQFIYVFISGLFLAFHYFLIVYINSTFLGEFASRELIGTLYMLGAMIDIIILLNITKIASKISFYKIMLFLSVIGIASLCVLATSETPLYIFFAFILHHTITPLLLLCLNICLEDETMINNIGKIRGAFLTTLGGASIIAPMVGSVLFQVKDDVRFIYLLSAFFMFLFLLSILTNFRGVNFGKYKTINTRNALKELVADKNISIITFAGILLQLMFSWFIIYLPIYLHQELGFELSDIGILISITLIPFVLLEMPVGELSDEKYGEKEFLLSGVTLSGIALITMSFLTNHSIIIWGLIILLARIGASVMESAVETYFYKKTKGKDELISVFSLGTPFAYILGPILGSVALYFLPIQYMFMILGIILVCSIPFLSEIEDTK